jgi:hypothetical protein
MINPTARRKAPVILGVLTLALLAAQMVFTQPRSILSSSLAPPPLPNPVLYMIIQEPFQADGKQWIRYKFSVENFSMYPNELFAAAPDLPPCGKNSKSSRTWVDFYDQMGKRLSGFCALGKNSDLNSIWFALETDVLPPSWVYIEMNDRQTNTKYRSNLADTTQ